MPKVSHLRTNSFLLPIILALAEMQNKGSLNVLPVYSVFMRYTGLQR